MNFRSILIVLLAFTGVTLAANATPVTGQITVDGYAESANSVGMGAADGIDFATGASGSFSGSSGDLTSFGGGLGSFAALSCASPSGGCGTIDDIADFATEPATSSFLTLDTGGPTITFDLSSITRVTNGTDMSGGSVTFTADGTINFDGYDPTAGTLILTAEGNNVADYAATLVATEATPAPTPEPGTLVLLTGPMLLGAFQQLRRKARI